jgi:glucose/arabinose dehydrogenase
MLHRIQTIVAAAATWAVMVAAVPLLAETGTPRLEGKAAFGDWSMDKPGTRRLIRPQDLPTADQAHSATNFLYHVARSERQKPVVPSGFDVKLFASGLSHQRLIRVAPNGHVFAAESEAGRIRVLRPNRGQSAAASIFADGLHGPFGIAFYPPGPDPKWVYVGNTDSVVRFAYRSGDLKARAPAETVVPHLPTGGSHRTRDVVFSPDGRTMYVSVGSASNVGDGMKKLSAAELQAWQSKEIRAPSR